MSDIEYYGKEGCCLTCDHSSDGCMCYECKCTKCASYDGEVQHEDGRCGYFDYRSEDYIIAFDRVVHETEKAVLLRIESRDVWFPKSQIYVDREKKEVQMPHWLAESNSLC